MTESGRHLRCGWFSARISFSSTSGKGATVALRKGFETIGTLGLLTRGAQLGLLDLVEALDRLKRTNFRYRQELFDDLLKKIREKRQSMT